MRYVQKTTLALLLSQTFLLAGGSLIPYVSQADAKGEVKNIYSEVKQTFGMIPAPIMQHSVSPKLLKNHWDFFKATGENKHFSPKFLAIMRMTIATSGAFAHCDYCVEGNAMMLKGMFKMSPKEIKAIQKDPSLAHFPTKEQTMLTFLLTATTDPASLHKDDFDALRALGWSDKDIFDGLKMATQMVAAIYMVNTLKIPADFQ